eukprot:6289289-Prymnesium_polylepis.1
MTVGATTITSVGANDGFVFHVDSAGALDWATQFGGSGEDYGIAIASYGWGGAIVTGSFRGTATFGSRSISSSSSDQNAFVMVLNGPSMPPSAP